MESLVPILRVILYPVCIVFAWQRIPFSDLRTNLLLWTSVQLAGNYWIVTSTQSGGRAIYSLVVGTILFVIAVLAGDRLSKWLEKRGA